MKEYAKSFYNSTAWRKCSAGYMQSKYYLCERCGGVAVICHHKRYITPENITNPNITLNWDNLEALCMDCHNIEHSFTGTRVLFDEAGNIETVKDSSDIKEYSQLSKDAEIFLFNFQKHPPNLNFEVCRRKPADRVVLSSPLKAGEGDTKNSIITHN